MAHMGKSSNHHHYLSANLQMVLGPLGRLHNGKAVKQLLSWTNSYPACNRKALLLMVFRSKHGGASRLVFLNNKCSSNPR